MSAWTRAVVKPGAILAWYCNHEDEPYGAKTHVQRELVRGKYVIKSQPGTISSVSGMAERPPCPRAVPLRARKRDLDKAAPAYPDVAS